jgi:glycosyltransferase involved in cell wall biosynthesis
MRIIWHGAHPDLPTGYANQARIWLTRLADTGHDVAISCLAGVEQHFTAWRTPRGAVLPVYPHTPYEQNGLDVLGSHYKHFNADLLITMTCSWIFGQHAQLFRDWRTIMITPVDIGTVRPGDRPGMSDQDHEAIVNTGATPAAVCRWGETQMRSRGLDPLYLPHGVETQVFRPPANRGQLRADAGWQDFFVVGLCAMNHERSRKNFDEAFGAFAAFREDHPDARLALHTVAILPEGLNLPAMAREWGIFDAILWSRQYELIIGATSEQDLADWYGACDVVLMLGNEGFGLPTIQAQACGTPVIAGTWCTGPELAGEVGWLVDGQPTWNNWHKKHWYTPLIPSVTEALEHAYDEASAAQATRRKRAREFALTWDADRVWTEHWEPVIKGLAGG